MIAIDNAALQGLCNTCNCAGFAPAVTLAIAEGVLTLTDASVFPATDEFKNINVVVTDANGDQVKGNIAAAAGDVDLDLTDLDLTKPVLIKATVVSGGGCISDGSASLAPGQADGALANWDKDFSGAVLPA